MQHTKEGEGGLSQRNVCLAGMGTFIAHRPHEHKASGDVNKALLAVAPVVVVVQWY
jgi:hypothetical protein